MPLRTGKLVPSTASKILVCIDSKEQADLSGRFYSIYFSGKQDFHGVVEMINKMDGLFDALSFPQAFFEYRTFHRKREPAHQSHRKMEITMKESEFIEERGQKATFVVQVQFRQNATWQGVVQWVEEKKEQKFRSTLELIKLMDEAARDVTAEGEVSWKETE